MIRYLIEKRKITLLFFLMAVMLGTLTFFRLPQQEMPDVIVQQALVTTTYPGAAPDKVEQTVTKILEQRIKEVPGVHTITSTSANGFSSILVRAEDGIEPQTVWEEMRKKVQDAQTELPEEADTPVINDNLTSSFIGSFAITAGSAPILYQLNADMSTWQDQLSSIQGVASVDIRGLPEQEVRVEVDPQKLQQYNLPWETIVQAVSNQIERVPTGDVEYGNRTYQLIVKEAENAEGLSQVLLTRTDAGAPVYLRDVGTVQLGHSKADYFPYVDGKPAITLNIGGEMGTDVPSLSKKVNDRLTELKKTLPPGAEFRTLLSQEDHVNDIFNELSRETIFAIFAVIFTCMLGLRLFSSFFVALSIPISVSLGVIFLPALGITLNQISVVGLIIVLGILVDDAVVVNENIERRLSDLGESPEQAALNGTKEVSVSILTATLATICSFAPLMFLSGNIGAFIKPIPTIISLTMLASMIVSLTIVPIFRQWYDRRRHKRNQASSRKPPGLLGMQLQSLNLFYAGRLMPKVVKRPLLTGIAGLLIGTSAYGLVLATPVELFPKSDEPHLILNIKLPLGTSLTETDRIVKEIANWVSEQPETAEMSYGTGGRAPTLFNNLDGDNALNGDQFGQIAVIGKPGQFDLNRTVNAWKQHFSTSYPGVTVTPIIAQLGIPVGKPVSVRITGSDLDQLQALALQVKEAIAEVEGTSGIEDDIGIERHALELEVNKQAMDQFLVDYTELTQTLLLMSEGINMSEFDTGRDLVDIKLYIDQNHKDPYVLFQQLNVTNNAGSLIPLSQLAQLRPASAIQQIKHYNLERTVTIESNLEGKTALEAVREVRERLGNIEFPEGYTWQIGGETSEQSEIFLDLASLAVIVIFLIVGLITIQFYSISIPLIVMTTVYLAAAGGILGMFLTGTAIGFMSIMGIIALAGIVVRNGIVLIEFIEDARKNGSGLQEAIIQAASARFRPILLTSTTAIVGMLPIAFMGSLLFKPLAYTIIFGLLFSTLLTLFVVPALYMVSANYKLKRRQNRLTHSDHIDLDTQIQ